MKKFQFKLRGLLRIRQAQEKEVKRQLMEVQALCAQREVEIKETEKKVVDWSNYYNAVIAKRVNATELAVIDKHLQNLYRFKEQQLIGLEILNRKKEDMIAYYKEVLKELKTVEHLREKKWDEYRDEFRKAEEKEADEIATLRYARERMAL
jgi:flagellar FliJ protein